MSGSRRNTRWSAIRRPARLWLAPRDARTNPLRRREGDLTAVWRYAVSDPFAVTLRIPQHFGGSRRYVPWTFARDLLAESLFGHHDLAGDVRISPDADEIRIELTGITGRIALWAQTTTAAEFLVRSYDLVPLGTEPDRINWERERRVLGMDADSTGWGAAA